MVEPRMTMPTLLVLQELLITGREMYGLEILRNLPILQSGTVYPILTRLHHAGWMDSREEDGWTRATGRPPRQYFRLTAKGEELTKAALARTGTMPGLNTTPASRPGETP